MTKPQDIYTFVIQQEQNYELPVPITDGWDWSMKEHIRLSVLYKNSQFSSGKDDNKPFKNIIRPILNLQYRAEGFDVKDIELFVNDAKNYYKSFLIKKYHDKWARNEEIDTFIDEMVESYIDFGGALIKNVNTVRPEVVPLQSIAFCDQTDMLSGPIGIKHFFSPDQLQDMAEVGWGDEKNGATASIEEVITLADDYKVKDKKSGEKAKTPGKYIEVYEVHGNMPESFLDKDSEKYSNQMHIVCFYQDSNGTKQGLTLFRAEEKKSIFKLVLRDKIYGRALGLGGAEELFEPQVWTNYGEIRIKGMLDAASKVIIKTTDEALAARHPSGLKNLENLEIVTVADGKDVGQMDTTPRNINLFENKINEWEAHAQQMGAANDSIMGKSPNSGTPFKLQELVTQESHGLHEYRKGKLATFLDGVYKDWIIPYISKEITKGQEFIAELEADEMQQIGERVADNIANRMVVEQILNGEQIGDRLAMKEQVQAEFLKGGNKRFIEILKDDFKNTPIDVRVNIAGKQKDLAGRVDKLVNVFRTVLSAPQVLQDPSMAKLFNEILEASGLSPIIYRGFTAPMQQLNTQQMPQPAMLNQ